MLRSPPVLQAKKKCCSVRVLIYVNTLTELDSIVAAFALDWSAGPIVQLPTAGQLVSLLRDFNELTPDLHLEPPNEGWLFMTDAYAFSLAGLPGIAPLIRAPGYSEQAHSAEDTLDKISAADLRQATTVLAMARTGIYSPCVIAEVVV